MVRDEERWIQPAVGVDGVDGAEAVWDPWLLSMYVDVVRTQQREQRWLH